MAVSISLGKEMSMHNICHVEIPTTDLEKSNAFYSNLFGWKITVMPQMHWASFETGAEPGGGFSKVEKVSSVGEQGVLLYVSVENIQEALARVMELGGSVIKEKTEIPEMGWYAHFADPFGNIIGIYEASK
jgi:predicted enzyme related to lactoylglutathione lyase